MSIGEMAYKAVNQAVSNMNAAHNSNGMNSVIALGIARQTAQNAIGAGATTSVIPEGSNFYFTTARARNSLSATAPIMYDPVTGVISSSIGVSNVNNLQTLLDAKQATISGYTGTINIVTGVNFATSTVTNSTITVTNGVITNVV